MRLHKTLPLILVLAALPAQATITYYCPVDCGTNTETAFNIAFGNLLTAGLTSSGYTSFSGETSGSTVSDVGSTTVDYTGFNGLNPDVLNVVGTQLRNTTGGSGTGVLISLAAPNNIFAFGTHVTASGNMFGCFEATPSSCDVPIFLNTSTTMFVGVISDVPLADHRFRGTTQSGKLYTNNFEVAETPEGPTFLLVGLGLISLPLLKRRMLRHWPQAQAVARTQ